MTPELTYVLLSAGGLVLGYLARHYLAPKAPTPGPAPGPAPTPSDPIHPQHPVWLALQQLLQLLGPILAQQGGPLATPPAPPK